MRREQGRISDQIQDLLKQININMGNVIGREMIEFSPLTIHQMYILKVINQNAGVNLTSLCNEFCQTKGAMSLTINKLVDDGYVLRKENVNDRRNMDIFLTDKGKNVLREATKKVRECFLFLTASLADSELKEIQKSLEKLNSSIHHAMTTRLDVE